MIQTIYNEYGEPIGTETVRTQYEEEIAYCEEMDRRAEDPFYAARIEEQEWYNKACAIFEENGIVVPDDVIAALSRELRKKEAEREEQKALAEVQPVVDFLNKYFPNKFYARYDPPTPDEYGYAYVDFNGNYSERPYRDEVEALIPIALEQDIYIEDYLSLRHLRKRD